MNVLFSAELPSVGCSQRVGTNKDYRQPLERSGKINYEFNVQSCAVERPKVYGRGRRRKIVRPRLWPSEVLAIDSVSNEGHGAIPSTAGGERGRAHHDLIGMR